MPRSTSIRATGVIAMIAATAFALSACAPEPQTSPSPSPSATAEPVAYSGPLVFVGDELELLLPTSEEIAQVIPGATEITAPTGALVLGDGGGPEPAPAVCAAFFIGQPLWSVGARTASWRVSDAADARTGFVHALAFADEEQAQNRMDQLLDAAEQCATFDYNGPATFEGVIADPSDDVRAFAGTVSVSGIEGGGKMFHGFASVGNVLVNLWSPLEGGTAPDADAVATLLRDHAEQARTSLIDQLTANPPTSEEVPATDAAAPWSEWAITVDGVGPILLGDSIDVALDAVPGAQVTEPEYDGLPWKIVSADGAASLWISTPEEDGTTVSVITVGTDRTLDGPPQDGAALPARGDVRVGDPVSQAIEAFPGGTSIRMASSGDYSYETATRDGHLFRFHTDRDAAEADAVVVGITVEDATVRRELVFG
ncbi:hypothetical protein [Microbacterium sp. NPDC087591]|uniref:hypothetical protein n=1 Tax=Microbacterium sp. NPDC087591 TaxID=3364192 RepID=UPI0038175C21